MTTHERSWLEIASDPTTDPGLLVKMAGDPTQPRLQARAARCNPNLPVSFIAYYLLHADDLEAWLNPSAPMALLSIDWGNERNCSRLCSMGQMFLESANTSLRERPEMSALGQALASWWQGEVNVEKMVGFWVDVLNFLPDEDGSHFEFRLLVSVSRAAQRKDRLPDPQGWIWTPWLNLIAGWCKDEYFDRPTASLAPFHDQTISHLLRAVEVGTKLIRSDIDEHIATAKRCLSLAFSSAEVLRSYEPEFPFAYLFPESKKVDVGGPR